jgi:hypothetical protein
MSCGQQTAKGQHDNGLMDIRTMREAPDLIGRKGLEVPG